MLLMLADAAQKIDLSPLIPVINGLITAVAGVAAIATPMLAYYAVMWLRNHGIKVSNEAQGELIKQADNLIQKGLSFSTATADGALNNIKVASPNETVTKAASYAIAQAPALLKKLGFDPTTEEGQQAIVRMVTARLIPTPPVPDTQVGLTINAAPPAAEQK
jgi:hypothetical protein